ncbi:hypothetical protein L228DRAFT_284085 [Xylona heveae TC161]|uniref:Uncharacterized protein n=1 Tax=Xylona heveae (strain CBS 132557 / TC161) TaxID=1328760 RepID=A0A165FI10_XYLHT|nr:hypothetical protein L228DRAFT_284085 [Xylona heveae TC161]KZF21001.1 hypothetical protein L228DRAFT_284085 [Xylona heveae TC161]
MKVKMSRLPNRYHSEPRDEEDVDALVKQQILTEVESSSPIRDQGDRQSFERDESVFLFPHDQEDSLSQAGEACHALNAHALSDSPSRTRQSKSNGDFRSTKPLKVLGKRRRQTPQIIIGAPKTKISGVSRSRETSDASAVPNHDNHGEERDLPSQEESTVSVLESVSDKDNICGSGNSIRNTHEREAKDSTKLDKLNAQTKRLDITASNSRPEELLNANDIASSQHERASESRENSPDHSENDAATEEYSSDDRAPSPIRIEHEGRVKGLFARPFLLLDEMLEVAEKYFSYELAGPKIAQLLRSIDCCQEALQDSNSHTQQGSSLADKNYESQLEGVESNVAQMSASPTNGERNKKLILDIFMGVIPRLIRLLQTAAECFLREPPKEDSIKKVLRINRLIQDIELKVKGWKRGKPRGDERLNEIREQVLAPNVEMIKLLKRRLVDLTEREQMANHAIQRQVQRQYSDNEAATLEVNGQQDRMVRLQEEKEEQISAARALSLHCQRTIVELKRRQSGSESINRASSLQSAGLVSIISYKDINQASKADHVSDDGIDDDIDVHVVPMDKIPSNTRDDAETWPDQQLLALLDGLQQHLGSDRYAAMLHSHGQAGKPLHGMSIEQIQGKAKEVKAGLEAYLQRFPGETLPEWVLSI